MKKYGAPLLLTCIYLLPLHRECSRGGVSGRNDGVDGKIYGYLHEKNFGYFLPPRYHDVHQSVSALRA